LRKISESRPRPIEDINPRIPDWLAEIIEKLHEKDPADRLETAAEVAELLGAHLAHLQHPRSAPMPPRVSGRRSVRRRIGRVIALWRVVLAICLLAGLVGLWAIVEAVGITRVFDFVTGNTRSSSRAVPASVLLPSSGEDMTKSAEETPGRATVSSQPPPEAPSRASDHAAGWHDDIEDDLNESRRRLEELENAAAARRDAVATPDEPAAVANEVDELELQMNDDWP
jgi:hypothetical protein